MISVLYATVTGNAEYGANQIVERLVESGHAARAIDLSDYSVTDLAEPQQVLIITSTTGNGDPPDSAVALHTYVQRSDVTLPQLRYGVLALGDSIYPNFAQCGRDFDQFLAERGAHRMFECIDCDGDLDLDEAVDILAERALESLRASNEQRKIGNG